MSSNFAHAPNRRAFHSVKWSVYDEDVLPMWVADMDFASPQPIIDALTERVQHGVFGYGLPSKELDEAICTRLDRLYGWQVTPEQIVYLPGLVSGLNAVARSIGSAGDGVLATTPVYGPFLTAPANQGRALQVAELAATRGDHTLRYELDFDAFQNAIRPNTKLFMLCHPHNPVGRAWNVDELASMAEICAGHDMVICSDEIHCDLLLDGAAHTPLAALDPEISARTITLMAPSKTFNVPGLGMSFAIVQNEALHKQMEKGMAGIVPHTNILGYTAALAAYTQCDDWLADLRMQLTANRDMVTDFVKENLPGIRITVPEATYLSWLDCTALAIPDSFESPADFFKKEAKVAMNDGAWFGKGGAGFVRFNFGTSPEVILEGLTRIQRAVAGL
ncbi:MAG: PatB family C-S lyase [Caldilineaceae bacterium]|nr:PatB family C-S lyase [Caldilineaceae bacterium]MBP8109880.1 PatB family C-S lyase [Caldilineaceae bacterium]MBP8122510.1 PatB family C-S lyase [Caldilineaceae bacterium]MBP9072963.1 PatB family C-S lyase [Caldilineaceae bacterium]